MYLLQNDYHIKVNQHIYNLTYLQFSYFGEDFFFSFFAAAMAGGSSGARHWTCATAAIHATSVTTQYP